MSSKPEFWMPEYKSPPPPDETHFTPRWIRRPVMPAVRAKRKTRDKILTHQEIVKAAMIDLERCRRKGLAR